MKKVIKNNIGYILIVVLGVLALILLSLRAQQIDTKKELPAATQVIQMNF